MWVFEKECLCCTLLPCLNITDESLKSNQRLKLHWHVLRSEYQLRETVQDRNSSPKLQVNIKHLLFRDLKVLGAVNIDVGTGYLECFCFIKPFLGFFHNILQLQAVGQKCWDVFYFLKSSIKGFYALIRSEITVSLSKTYLELIHQVKICKHIYR